MSLQTASEASHKIQVQVDQSLRRVNTTDHNLEQLEGLQVGVYCLVLSRAVFYCYLQADNSDLARQLNTALGEVSALRSDFASRAGRWRPEQRSEAGLSLDR